MNSVPALQTVRVSKRFGAVNAVNSVDFSVSVGEVVGLLGENGAGKSTLLSLMSGSISPDEGSVLLHGNEVHLKGYHEGTTHGVFRIFQHQALVPNLTVAENVFLAQEKRFSRFGVLNDRKIVSTTREIFSELGVSGIRPEDRLARYGFAERQVVEIVRSLAQANLLGIDHPVILLDEPTSALSREQIDFFFEFVRRVKHRAAQVFVSHRLLEVLQLCDRFFVMKDGHAVADIADPAEVSEARLHQLMVGRSQEAEFETSDVVVVNPKSKPTLRVSNLTGPSFAEINLEIRPGEIVGIAGVLGSGKSELARAIFEGGRGTREGTIEFCGEELRGLGPGASIRRGMGYVPPERHAEGIIEVLSVSKNISLPAVGAMRRDPVLNTRKEEQDAREAVELLKIKTPSVETPIRSLSGGNQQKVVLARWTSLKTELLVLDNPTNGVDVGAKVEIYRIIKRLTERGASVMLVSDDLQEIIGLSDRIIVMKDGLIISEVTVDAAGRPAEVDIVAHMV